MGKLNKISKKWYVLVGIVLILVGIFIWNSNKKYDLTKDAVVTFDGYDSRGSANYNSESIVRKMFFVVGEKENISKEDVSRLIEGKSPLQNDPKIYYKLSEIKRILDDTKIEFSKNDDLSNGEKIKLIVKTTSKDNPFKDVQKTYTVKGLKKVTKVSIGDIKDNLDIKFKGFNGKGLVALKSKKYKNMKFNVKTNGKLSNNDTVKLILNTNNFNYNGKKFVGNKKTISTKVTGLKDPDKIENLQDVIQASTDYANSLNKNDDYTDYKIELVNFYMKDHVDGYFESNPDTTVYVNQKVKIANKYDVFGLYRVTESSEFSDKPEVNYFEYGYYSAPLRDNKLDIDSLSTETDGMNESPSGTLPVIQRNLKSEAILIN